MENKNDEFEIIDIPNGDKSDFDEDNNFNNTNPDVQEIPMGFDNEEPTNSFAEMPTNFEMPQNDVVQEYEPVQEPTSSFAEMPTNSEIPQNDVVQEYEPVQEPTSSFAEMPTNSEMPQNDVVQEYEQVQEPMSSFAEMPTNSEIPQNDVVQEYEQVQEPMSSFAEMPTNSEIPQNDVVQEPISSFIEVPNGRADENFENENSKNMINTNSQNNKKRERTPMDKSLKETIVIGIIIAIVILLLPTFYTIMSGRNETFNNIKNSISNVFNKKENNTSKKLESDNTTTPIKENEEVEEEEEETSEISFDGSKYNNQVISYNDLMTFLKQYNNNIISLSSTSGNKTTVNASVQIARDIKKVDYSISDPAAALETFSSQYLNNNYKYLITINENYSDNIILISINNK